MTNDNIDKFVENITILMDGAPITVQNSNPWPSKTFKRHVPVLHLFALLRERYPVSLVTPVIDAKSTHFESMLPDMHNDFERFVGLQQEELWLIDEAAIKQPRHEMHEGKYNDSIIEWVNFLNTLDVDILKKIDAEKRFSQEDLIWSGHQILDIRDQGRLKCTIAELIVYYEKMKYLTNSRLNINEKIVLLTGYDEGYLFLYGNGRHFKQIQPSLEASLSKHYGKEVIIIDFMYGLNPDKNFNPVEFSKSFSTFSQEQQHAIRITNATYCLATAFYLDDKTKDTVNEQDLQRLRFNATRPELRDELYRLIMSAEITSRSSIMSTACEIYGLLK